MTSSCDQKSAEPLTEEGPKVPTKRKRERLPASDLEPIAQEIAHEIVEATKEEDRELRDQRLAEIAWSRVGLRPDLVEAVVLEMSSESKERQPLIQLLVSQLSEQSPDDAIRWIDQIKDTEGKMIAREQLASILAETDPQRALRELPRESLPNESVEQTRDYVLKRWVSNSPKEALDWLNGSYSIDRKEERVPEAIGQWMEIDSTAAINWIDKSLAQDLRIEAVASARDHLLKQPPEVRNPVVEQLEPRLREELGVDVEEIPEGTEAAIPEEE